MTRKRMIIFYKDLQRAQPTNLAISCFVVVKKTSWNVKPTLLGGRLLLVAIRWQSGGWTLGTIPTVRTAGLMLLPLLLLSAFPCFATSLFAVLPESELHSITRCRFVEGIKRVAFGEWCFLLLGTSPEMFFEKIWRQAQDGSATRSSRLNRWWRGMNWDLKNRFDVHGNVHCAKDTHGSGASLQVRKSDSR